MAARVTGMAERIYLDWNATAPLRPEARAAVLAALDRLGNPSSVHAEGRVARAVIEDARREVAALVGARPADVTFTSGGTEANMLALGPDITRPGQPEPRDRLLVSAVEHPSVLAGGTFPPEAVERIPVAPSGRVDPPALARRLGALAAAGITRPLVSVMLANNESGIIQPIAEIGETVHAAGGLLHVDAVQALGRMTVDRDALKADLLSISAHKIGGPKGAGALIRAADLHVARPVIRGGGQERGLRAGTENVAAIAGFGAAAAATRQALDAEGRHMAALRDRLEEGLKAISPAITIFGESDLRLPNTTLCAIRGQRAETAVIALDLAGIAVSAGAACSSGKVQPSHVLAAMGVDAALAGGAIRLSLGYRTTESTILRFLDAWRKLLESLHKRPDDIAASSEIAEAGAQ